MSPTRNSELKNNNRWGRVSVKKKSFYTKLQQVNVDSLDAEALQKVSTGYLRETIPALEELMDFEGMITAGFSPENEGILPTR